ncbi:dephospho-CoA kinase [Peptacetobacter sp. AB845]|uniref:dephospho-CoA kinase n=1 Tax=Peptacetobacter sp. AB845 TaxID=3388429 RepID=UPI0039C998BC
MLKVGLTGSIGCGKSSLSNILKKYDIPIIDADIKGREIYENKELLRDIEKSFGSSVINKDGTLNRKNLGKIVFNDDYKLEKLNSLTHPVIQNMIKDDLNKYEKFGKKIAVVDAALLIEAGFMNMLDTLVVVTCSEEVQLQRVVLRDNCSEEDAMGRIKSQMPQDEKVKYAEFVVDNSGTIEHLEKEAEKLIKSLEAKIEEK